MRNQFALVISCILGVGTAGWPATRQGAADDGPCRVVAPALPMSTRIGVSAHGVVPPTPSLFGAAIVAVAAIGVNRCRWLDVG